MYSTNKEPVIKFFKRENVYRNSTGSLKFDPTTKEAHSYRWWKFTAVLDGLLVFNNYTYSNSTAKHQSKVRSLLRDLNIKIDLEMPLPKGINTSSIESAAVEAEEYLCDKFLSDEIKRDQRNEESRRKRFIKKIENKLENELFFRDYSIERLERFGKLNDVAVHQVIERESMDHDIENAMYNFSRDGFSKVVFYV